MKIVQPIRDKNKIQEMKTELRKKVLEIIYFLLQE